MFLRIISTYSTKVTPQYVIKTRLRLKKKKKSVLISYPRPRNFILVPPVFIDTA